MLLGKISQATRYINNDDATLGIHPLNEEIKDLLNAKHPKKRAADSKILLPQTSVEPHPVIYEGINGGKIYDAALTLNGSGGPTLLDAEGWKHILCSKSYGTASSNLCDAITELAKKLCREQIHPDSLNEFITCRLIPLDKGVDK